jgi:hypothetical protein
VAASASFLIEFTVEKRSGSKGQISIFGFKILKREMVVIF